jgi:hypothetical protein
MDQKLIFMVRSIGGLFLLVKGILCIEKTVDGNAIGKGRVHLRINGFIKRGKWKIVNYTGKQVQRLTIERKWASQKCRTLCYKEDSRRLH